MAAGDGVIRRERGDTGRWIYRVTVPYEVLRAGINRIEVGDPGGQRVYLHQLDVTEP